MSFLMRRNIKCCIATLPRTANPGERQDHLDGVMRGSLRGPCRSSARLGAELGLAP